MPVEYTPVITGTKAFNLINTSDLSFVLAQVINAMEYKLHETAAELEDADSQILADMNNLIAANDALIFKGVINGTNTSPGAYTPSAQCGHVYKVATAGYVNGQKVEVGDTFICTADNTAAATSSTYSSIQNNWIILQTNADGIVIGPASATSGRIVTFNGTTGKLIQDSGKSFTTTTPSSSSTDATIPTSKAVWSLIDDLDVSNISGFDPGATLASLSETDGKISATFQDIEITASQVSDLSITLNGETTTTPSFYAPVNNGNAGYILKANGQNNGGDDIPPTWIEAVPVENGGTGMTDTGDINAVVIGNSTSITGAMQTIRSGDGAFYATGVNAKPQFGTLPVAQGGTGATTFTSGALLIGNGTSAVGTRSITNNTTNTSITNNNTNIPTMNTIYYGLAQINGASQNRGVSIYAPITTGTNGQTLVSSGSGAPTWASKSLVQIVRW